MDGGRDPAVDDIQQIGCVARAFVVSCVVTIVTNVSRASAICGSEAKSHDVLNSLTRKAHLVLLIAVLLVLIFHAN